MLKLLMGIVFGLLMTTAAFAGLEPPSSVPEITLTTAAAGVALFTGGSLLISDKLRKRI